LMIAVLGTALAGRCDCIMTGDHDLLASFEEASRHGHDLSSGFLGV